MTTYGTTDRCTGGTATANNTYDIYVPSRAVDDNPTTQWLTTIKTNAWWKYDFGANVSWAISKITLQCGLDSIYTFTIAGSNNDLDWTNLYSGIHANNTNVQTFNFTTDNKIKYRYIRLTESTYGGNSDIAEIEMFELLIYKGGFGYGNPMIF